MSHVSVFHFLRCSYISPIFQNIMPAKNESICSDAMADGKCSLTPQDIEQHTSRGHLTKNEERREKGKAPYMY